MRHYFIYTHKGNPSEQLVKTPWDKRTTFRYKIYHEDRIEVFEFVVGEDDVTEETIRALYAAEDHEVYENLKARRPERTREEKAVIEEWKQEYIRKFNEKHGYDPNPSDVAAAADEAFPRNWSASLDEIMEGNNDEDDKPVGDKARILAQVATPSEPGVIEKMDEIAATWPESWQEIYERVLKGGETIVSIARERNVTEGAVRKTLNKIRTRLAENKELQKFIRYFD
jgi:hypothetical protein